VSEANKAVHKYSLSSLIARNIFALGFIVMSFYIILLVLSAYDLEDKILISVLNTEADEASLVDTIEDYNQTAPSQFTLYKLSNLPKWAKGEFSDEQRPIRELTSSKNTPVHGKLIQLQNGTKAILLFETQGFVQATTHIVNISKFIAFGCFVLLLAGFYFCYRTSKHIAKPITNFSKFVTQNSNLKNYNAKPNEVRIAELSELIAGYNQSIEQQVNLLAREKQLNQDISHELRTPLSVIHGALEVLQDAKTEDNKQAATERLFKISHQMQDLVNGVLWLSKGFSQDEMTYHQCDFQHVLNEIVKTFTENMGIPIFSISLEIKAHCLISLPPEVIQVIFRNLIANAIAYSENKSVKITLNGRIVSITNTLNCINGEKTVGFGVGLTIVNRLCEKFNISINTTSTNIETVIKLDFAHLLP
jgi:signal transduction histidine kinase